MGFTTKSLGREIWDKSGGASPTSGGLSPANSEPFVVLWSAQSSPEGLGMEMHSGQLQLILFLPEFVTISQAVAHQAA